MYILNKKQDSLTQQRKIVLYPLKYILSILALSTISSLSANTANELIDALKANKNNLSMSISNTLIKKAIKQEQYGSAIHITTLFTDTPSMQLNKYGYLKQSDIYNTVYQITDDKRYLVLAGATLKRASNSADTADKIALYAAQYDSKNPMLYYDKVINKADQIFEKKYLAIAFRQIELNHMGRVESYLENKVFDVNAKSKEDGGVTLLHMAVRHNKLEAVKTLIHQYNANINARDNDGDTPLDYAAMNGYRKISIYLQKTMLDFANSAN